MFEAFSLRTARLRVLDPRLWSWTVLDRQVAGNNGLKLPREFGLLIKQAREILGGMRQWVSPFLKVVALLLEFHESSSSSS